VNFVALDNSYASCSYSGGTLLYQPLVQSLPGSSVLRTNALEYFFVLGRNNTTWTGVGYVVNATNTSPLYPLYRFYAQTNISTAPVTLYQNFLNAINQSQWTNLSHVLDGVVHLTVRPYNLNGVWMTSQYQWAVNQWVTNYGIWFAPPYPGDVGCIMFTNVVPASVQLELGVLEDRTLQRALSLENPGYAPMAAQNVNLSNYLAQQSAHVQIFRQRVTIPSVDPNAYQ
jgi:hypothetical protein